MTPPVLDADLTRASLPAPIASTGVLGIGRGLDPEVVPAVAAALLDGGVRAFEITVDRESALASITRLARGAGDGLMIGAGTVMDADAAARAVAAGATFIVSPHTDEDVIAWCVARGVPVFPGALTPTEIVAAWRAGATAVKLFPASVAGPDFVREARGPLRDIPLIPTGGVTLETAASFISFGAAAVGMGSWLTGSGDPAIIRDRARQVVEAVRVARESATR